jgi:S-adenosylmethionine decarboxylase
MAPVSIANNATHPGAYPAGKPSPIALGGTQGALDCYNCDPGLLNDAPRLTDLLQRAAQQAGLEPLQAIAHQFHPQGVTVLVLLSASHLAIHTWPEQGYAAIDVFTCGDRTHPDTTCQCLLAALQPERHAWRVWSRPVCPAN